MVRRRRFGRRVLATCVASVAAAVGAATATSALGGDAVWAALAGLAAGSLGLALAARELGVVARTLDALTDGVRGFRQGDPSLRLAEPRRAELSELVSLYNELGDALRVERQRLYQRELLLDSVLQVTPVAILLSGPSGRIVYANRAARDLVGPGLRIEGSDLDAVLEHCPAGVREAARHAREAIVSAGEGEGEMYRVMRREFELNGVPHRLHLFERITPEMRRFEVQAFKSAIRVMHHEISNSLAPVRSLAHSVRQLAGRPGGEATVQDALLTIEDRAAHLVAFLEGYARFARLPAPRRERVRWPEFVAGVQALFPFRLDGPLPAEDGWFDAGQLQQVLINLLKNAHESGSPDEDILVAVRAAPGGGAMLRVSDRGRGMDGETLRRALLPFYSSKQSGAGLGLPLCLEIVELHGGRLQIENRESGGIAVSCWIPG